MSQIRELKIHYACDLKGCKAGGTAEQMPKGWTRVIASAIGAEVKEGVNSQRLMAHLCPDCTEVIMSRFKPSSHRNAGGGW